MKKNKLIKICLLISCFALVACDDETQPISNGTLHDSSNWYSETELEKVHLPNLKAPTNCTGKMSTSTTWFNDGYAFYQPCPNEEVMVENANTYFEYFKTNYEGKFGKTKFYASSSDTFYYYISYDNSLDAYRDDNPSPLYKFYYVTDTTLEDDGYLKEDAVYTFEIRYETNSSSEYMLKIFIEKAGVSHNGAIGYKYNLR